MNIKQKRKKFITFVFAGLLMALSFVLVQPTTGAANATRFTEAEGFARHATQFARSAVAFDRLGAAMLARTEAVQQVGLLDEGFEMYSEEIDWAARMHRANWEVWCVPAAVVTHYGGASSSQTRARTERLKWQSRQRYYRKHYSLIKRWLALRFVPKI